ncbi:MAG: hypothetical protein J0H64_04800, partial [Actinobacteria bacterium]|nr:hypothetical protein [Actinomycetota bacterium]
RVQDPTAAQQRIIGVLLRGVRSDRLAATLERSGATRLEWRSFLETLDPVLRRVPIADAPAHDRRRRREPRSRPREPIVAVLGDGPTAHAFRGACARADLRLLDPHAALASGANLAIVFERYLIRGRDCDPLIDSGLPHLPVRFGDACIGVGPLLSEVGFDAEAEVRAEAGAETGAEADPGHGDAPCLNCVRLTDFDADPALPVLAAQLVGRAPPTETPAGTEAAAALTAALIRSWWAGSTESRRIRYSIPFENGVPVPLLDRRTFGPHPECGCRMLRAGFSAQVSDPPRR